MHENTKRVLVLLHSDLRYEQRVNKEIETLTGAGFEVALVDFPTAGGSHATASVGYRHLSVRVRSRFLPKTMLFWFVKYVEAVVRFVCVGLRTKPHVVLCVDRLTLIPGWLVSRILRVPYIYDTQEIWSEVSGPLNRPRVVWLAVERFIARRARRVVVTDHFRSDIIANALHLAPSDLRIIMNLPRLSTLAACQRDLRIESSFETGKHLTVYAGAVSPGRHLEDAILALQHLPHANALVFVGFGDVKYYQALVALAAGAGVSDRFRILPAVKWSEIPDFIAKADCALALYDRSSVNNLYCSPSKLFDALAAGLAVVGTDNPLIVEVLESLEAGEVVKDVSPVSLAAAIMKAGERLDETRRVALMKVARARFSWESQERDFVHMFEDASAST